MANLIFSFGVCDSGCRSGFPSFMSSTSGGGLMGSACVAERGVVVM